MSIKHKSCNRHCPKTHVPNEETDKVLRETDEGNNLVEHETLDEFWKALGLENFTNSENPRLF